MTDWRRKKDPSGAWLAINRYVPDGVIVISATHCEADTFRSVNVKHPDYYVAHKDHYTHWAPIRRPGMIAEPIIMKDCHPPIVNITFGDVHIWDEDEAAELQGRVTDAVRKALGQDGKQQLLQNPDCRVCRYYAETCSARWAGGPKYGPHGCYEPKLPRRCGSPL